MQNPVPMKRIVSLTLVTAFFVTTSLSAELPALPDEKSNLTQVKVEKSSHSIVLHWRRVEKEKDVSYVLDVTVNSEGQKSLLSMRLITFGEDDGEWSWGQNVPEGKPFGAKEATWLSLATNLMNRFVVTGDDKNIVVDKLPWKLIGNLETLRSYEVPYSFLFERNGKYTAIEPYLWLGDEPKVGDSITLGAYHPTSTPVDEYRYFSASITESGKINLEVGVAEAIAKLKQEALRAEKP